MLSVDGFSVFDKAVLSTKKVVAFCHIVDQDLPQLWSFSNGVVKFSEIHFLDLLKSRMLDPIFSRDQ